MIYTIIAIVALSGVISLSVDFGRVQTAKTELQNAVDAAARYAATGVADNTFVTKAQQAAAENTVDGSALSLEAGDVVSGTWNSTTRVFTAGGSSPNAIRVSGRRTAARGNAIPLMFARVLGPTQCNVTAESIALFTAAAGASGDVVGLDAVTITGSGKIQRWANESGTVTVASNGAYTLSWGQYIYGDVLYRGASPNPPGNGITGTKTAMSSDLVYPTVSADPALTNLNNWNVGWQGATLAAGNYRANSITLGGGGTITLNGDVNIYCSGAVNIANDARLASNGTAKKLTIYVSSSSPVYFGVSQTWHARVYAPLSTVTLSGSTPFVGSVVAKNLVVEGSASLSYSSSLPVPIASTGGGGGGGGGSGTISMVE